MTTPATVNIARYAGTRHHSPYDLVTGYNREYQKIIAAVGEVFASRGARAQAIADLGCGSGNFTRRIAESIPPSPIARIEAVDFSEAMLDIARFKAKSWETPHAIAFRQADLLVRDTFPECSLDAINMVHTLHCIDQPRQVVANIAAWLKPGGFFCVVDIGRELVTWHWAFGLLRWAFADLRRRGASIPAALGQTAELLVSARDAAIQNQRFQKAQRQGRFTLHSPDEFAQWFRSVGLVVSDVRQMFFDPVTKQPISDLVLGHKP